jgi:peptide deformylase
MEDEEGCLSLPGVYAPVRRAKRIRVRAYDLSGNLVEHEADELFSRAVQHEADHLEGKLFIDHIDALALHSLGERLRGFESLHRKAQQRGEMPADADLIKRLETLARPSADASPNNSPG